jgi:hypothetical protein
MCTHKKSKERAWSVAVINDAWVWSAAAVLLIGHQLSLDIPAAQKVATARDGIQAQSHATRGRLQLE